MPLPTKTFEYYFSRTQRECGWQEEPLPPITQLSDWNNASPLQKRVRTELNKTLRLLNNRYWLAFQEVEYILTTVQGQMDYDISQPPDSQIFWRVDRMGRNGVIRVFDDFPLEYMDYTDIDYFRPQFTIAGRPIYYSGFKTFLRIYPRPVTQQLRIRYYPTAIAFDSNGNLQSDLVLATDVPTLNDEWEDVLVAGAVYYLRLTDRADSKTAQFKMIWDEQEALIREKTKIGGENFQRKLEIEKTSPLTRLQKRIIPFGTDLP